jgi:hypothetical protein
MNIDNQLWGAPHIRGSCSTSALPWPSVGKYMAKKGGPSSRSWGTFHKQPPHIATMDLLVVSGFIS